MRFLIAYAVLMLCLPTSVQAQATALLVGNVLADSTERPVANAEISIAALNLSARSDSTGAFALGNIPAGRHVVVVRALSYAELSTPMTFAADQRVEADLMLRPAAQALAKVKVTAAKSTSGDNPRISEFDERRKIGIGHFLTQATFENGEGRKLSEILIGSIPGVRTQQYSGRRALYSSRGLISFLQTPSGDKIDKALQAQARCYVQIIIDDMVRYGGGGDALFDIDQIDPTSIAAVEYYSVSQQPAQFNRGGNAPCGTLVIWSRWGPSRK